MADAAPTQVPEWTVVCKGLTSETANWTCPVSVDALVSV